VGFRPIKAQRCIAFASRSWRISGRAFIFSFSSGGALRFSRQYLTFGADALRAVFPAKVAISPFQQNDPACRNGESSAP
jgi:hypothetical protein